MSTTEALSLASARRPTSTPYCTMTMSLRRCHWTSRLTGAHSAPAISALDLIMPIHTLFSPHQANVHVCIQQVPLCCVELPAQL